MVTLRLAREWELGDPLDDGEGGFGQVYEVTGGDEPAVAKLIPKEPGADRELLFPAELVGARNVVPAIDQGEHDDRWVLVMPRATTSLHRFLLDTDGPLSLQEVVAILLDVCDALIDIDGQVVHRDLKPKNILLLDGHWCLADFGIARYADAATATNTWKGMATASYAAPERWRAEHATIATDVYSLGVVAFEMLVGHPPFLGTKEEIREGHLHLEAPRAEGAGPAMAAIIEECLFKAPEARPSPANLRRRLERVLAPPSSAGLQALVDANRAEVNRKAELARHASVEQTERERRKALVDAGRRLFGPIAETLVGEIESAAPATSVFRQEGGPWAISLNDAGLSLDKPIEDSSDDIPFTVVLVSEIELRIPQGRSVYGGRAHSLWYCDAQTEGEFHWYETAFMSSPLLGGSTELAPFALVPRGAREALGGVMGSNQVAWPFTELDVGELGEFVDRWAGWFAQAAMRQLQHPSMMPERPPQGSWRR
jgi:serine/threonine protein kinase